MIKIANKEFRTKKELEAFTREFLTDNDNKTIDAGEYGSKFLLGLVMRHPSFDSKVSGDISCFYIHRNFGGHIALSIKDQEGVKKEISWKKCVSQNGQSYMAKLKGVCRNEVTNQIQLYKNDHYVDGMECPSCHIQIWERKNAHVDHSTIPFIDIFNDFYDANFKEMPKDFTSAGDHLGNIFMGNDELMASLWRKYHEDRAVLQILCSVCNIRKASG